MISVIKILNARCDGCGKEVQKIVDLQVHNAQTIAKKFRDENGWVISGPQSKKAKTYCPECKQKRRKVRGKRTSNSIRKQHEQTRDIIEDMKDHRYGGMTRDQISEWLEIYKIKGIDDVLPLIKSERTRKVLFEYYGLFKTLKEIGDECNVTRERVRQIINKGRMQAVDEMRKRYTEKLRPSTVEDRTLKGLLKKGDLKARTVHCMSVAISKIYLAESIKHEPSIDDVSLLYEDEILSIRNMGVGSKKDLEQAMEKYGVKYRED